MSTMLSKIKKFFSAPEHNHPVFGVMKYDGSYWKSDILFPNTTQEIFVIVEGRKEIEYVDEHKQFWESLQSNYASLLKEILIEIQPLATKRCKRQVGLSELEGLTIFTDVYAPNSNDKFIGWTMGFVFEKRGFNVILEGGSITHVEDL